MTIFLAALGTRGEASGLGLGWCWDALWIQVLGGSFALMQGKVELATLLCVPPNVVGQVD